VAPQAVGGEARAWLDLRAGRPESRTARFRGHAGVQPERVYAVSAVERYLDCPFKYFATSVLRLEEEPDDQPGLTPQERGQFVHGVFEAFFRRWQEGGRGEITVDNLDEALEAFAQLAEEQLARLAESDRALERTHLLGSAAASGLAERAFGFEIEQGGRVIRRLLEHRLEGEFQLESDEGPRTVRLRAKADRIDVLDDGTLRIVDYKLRRAPKPARALQVAVYGACAVQHLAGAGEGRLEVGQAGYVAFAERHPFVSIAPSGSDLASALRAGQGRFLGAIDAIERGEFPPRPEEPFRCIFCPYPTVCRKDYVGDE
jgi:RecB family exonuclease